MKLLECMIRSVINFFAYLILSLVAIYCLIFIANFLAGQAYNLTHGEYFLVWIVMAVFIRQVSGDISVLFFKKSLQNLPNRLRASLNFHECFDLVFPHQLKLCELWLLDE